MSWLAIAVLAVGIYLAFKLAGVAFKLLMWGLVLLAAYWLLAPLLGMPRPF